MECYRISNCVVGVYTRYPGGVSAIFCLIGHRASLSVVSCCGSQSCSVVGYAAAVFLIVSVQTFDIALDTRPVPLKGRGGRKLIHSTAVPRVVHSFHVSLDG
jgi:hypothetical protein